MERLTLNPYIGISKTSDSLVIYMYSTRNQVSLDYDPALERLFDIARTTESEYWLSRLNEEFSISQAEFSTAMESLQDLGIVVPTDSVTHEDTVFARQDAYFTGAGYNGPVIRQRLAQSTVLLFGVGGIGSGLVEQLSVVGVHNYILVDADKVEQSNMNRTLIFNPSNVGQYKVDAIRNWIQSRDSEARVITYRRHISCPTDVQDILDLHQNISLVVSCMDEPDTFTAASWVTEACWPNGIPHFISGGYHMHGGLIGQTCIPGETPCAACYAYGREMDQFKLLFNPQIVGSYFPLVRLVTSYQVMEIIRILTAYEPPIFTTTTYNIDAANMQLDAIDIVQDPACTICAVKGGEKYEGYRQKETANES